MSQTKKAKELVNKYSYQIEFDVDDNIYIGKCAELAGLTAHGKTQEKALKEVKLAALNAVEWMLSDKELPPEPLSLSRFSGQFRVRMAPEKHREIAIESSLQGLSMNQYILNKL